VINVIKGLIFKVYKLLFWTFGILLPKNKKLVVFESFLGKQYSDNPRAIYEYMLRHKPEYKMYWSIEKKSIKTFKDLDIKTVPRFSIEWLFLMTRAKYWVSNSRLPLWIPKPRKTIYIQTWHGSPLKRIDDDIDEVHMTGTNTISYKKNFLKESGKWDYLISPNRYSSEIFARAFQFDKEMIESGYPRNDFLINSKNEKIIKQIKEQNGLPRNKKVILYAPTWRDNQFHDKGKYKFELHMDLKRLMERFGSEYIIVLRLHYLVAENLDLTDYNG